MSEHEVKSESHIATVVDSTHNFDSIVAASS